MALILVTDHAVKRFKQRKGLNILMERQQAKPLLAVAAMKSELFKNKPQKINIDGDTYILSYNKSVEGEEVCTIHTVIPVDIKYTLKQKIKKVVIKWLNDW